MAKKKSQLYSQVVGWAKDVADGKIIANKHRILAAVRFLRDLENPDYDFRVDMADFVIKIIEATFVHIKGDLKGQNVKLEPWEKFCCYNLAGFYIRGTNERRFKEAFIFMPRKNGKAVSLDTPIPTPDGWRVMESIHKGDYVFGQDGKPTQVLYESEIFYKPMFEVRFEDGEVIKASADHIWTVQTKDSRRTSKRTVKRPNKAKMNLRYNNGWYQVTTEEMQADYYHIRKDGTGKEYKYRVPINKAVEYSYKELPVHPYVLGVWLGDGSSNNTNITSSDADIEEMCGFIRECGYPVEIERYKNRASAIVVDRQKRGACYKSGYDCLRKRLKDLNLLKNKHIPQIYLQASIEQRLELLRGLMDTDGTVSKSGQCSFTQKSEVITKGIVELLSSLGIKNTVSKKTTLYKGKNCGDVYTVQFWIDKTKPCFKLKRKADRLKEKLSKRMQAKSIISIKPIECVPSKCIMVDNKNHLYLAGEKFTATHNTFFASALAWALALLERNQYASVYIVATKLSRAMEAFQNIKENIEYMGEADEFRIRDNNFEHSIMRNFYDENGEKTGTIEIQAIGSDAKRADGINAPIFILDELHAYKNANEYYVYKQATKAYTNKLVIGITTAGDNMASFCYQRLLYCKEILEGTKTDESYFVFLCMADNPDDYTNPIEHEKANPNYGVTIKPKEILEESLQAQNDPSGRSAFLNKSLNIYTAATKAYFVPEEYEESDRHYNWTIEDLSQLPVEWYGGADLSKLHDLTGVSLYGRYNGVDICITHAFIPITTARKKADEDNIPVFLWQEKGWLTTCNSEHVDYDDVVRWFQEMRDRGFKIPWVGYDRRYAREFVLSMRRAGFKMRDQWQRYVEKTEAFREIEKQIKSRKFYYLHNKAFEYCIGNVHAIEDSDEFVKFQKIQPHLRIDLFDASVIACKQMLKAMEKKAKVGGWFG